LEDLTQGLECPCVCDLKIGQRGHDNRADARKIVQQNVICHVTTSSAVGFRMCGMRIYQKDGTVIVRDKMWGSKLKAHTLQGALVQFIDNGQGVNYELIEIWLPQLKKLKNGLKNKLNLNFILLQYC